MNYHPEPQRPGFVTAGWVKRHFSISNSTLYAWIAAGILPKMVAIGPRARRFRLEDILRFEADRTSNDNNNCFGSW